MTSPAAAAVSSTPATPTLAPTFRQWLAITPGSARGGGEEPAPAAAQRGHEIIAADRAREQPGDVADQLVADIMPERIVDILEAIDVDVEEGGARGARARARHLRLEPFGER